MGEGHLQSLWLKVRKKFSSFLSIYSNGKSLSAKIQGAKYFMERMKNKTGLAASNNRSFSTDAMYFFINREPIISD